MKVLMSPSKTMAYDTLKSTKSDYYQGLSPITQEIFLKIKSFSKDDLKKLYKSSDSVVEDAIKKHKEENFYKAIELFNGAVFKNLSYQTLSQKEQDYIDHHVQIFSALYGLVPAKEAISPYRLDLNNSLKPHIENLTKVWKTPVNESINSGTASLIIDLASSEYRKLIDYKKTNKTIIKVDFKDFKDGTYKTVGTYAKMARGQFIRAMAMENVTTIKDLKALSVMDYTFDESLSDPTTLIFSRKK